MSQPPESDQTVTAFLRRWEASGAAERANYQLFLSELCDLLGVQRPDPTRPDDRDNSYVFERSVAFAFGDGSSSVGRIDLYKRGCFVLEAKQGSDRVEAQVKEAEAGWLTARRGTAVRGTKGWDVAMLKAKGQAEQYARALPVEEGWPPFLVVVDVGHAIELYSEFSCTGKTYLPFPDPRSYRIPLADLAHAPIRERLRLIWSNPQSLDPAKQSAKATRQVADRLATLAKSLEQAGHGAEAVGNFLKRCLFTMFAEDIGLIPRRSFTTLLESLKGQAEAFAPMAASLWSTMRDGGFSTVLREKLLRFNGGLFEEATALPVNEEQLALLIAAAKADWRDVEPAIFGTLLERALDPTERHHLGAHYTPREYVERLVLPTVIEPLRGDWEAVLAGAVTLDAQGDRAGAMVLVKTFHRTLCNLRILDPACGSGNFLYVTFEHLKRLEGEVLNALEGFGEEQTTLEIAGLTVDPHQLLGIEVNPRAAAITDMVLWIGYLQWHFRTRGQVLPPEPVIKKFHNVECRDAVLAYDGVEAVVDGEGKAVTRWDGRTMKTHPVTGEQVPDESAQEVVLRYLNPRQAEWPVADFVVGNPPFIGKQNIRQALGDGYVEALRRAWPEVPDSADFVMFWWQHAAELTRLGKLKRFGFITTNSLTQTFNRKIVQNQLEAKPSLSLAFAIADHPWVDAADGAAVRIAMTVGRATQEGAEGKLVTVTSEREGAGEGIFVDLATNLGVLHADLRIGANVAKSQPLRANSGVSGTGYILGGRGFVLAFDEAEQLRQQAPKSSHLIYALFNGEDIVGRCRNAQVIDTYGLSENQLRREFPELWQRLHERVYPERQTNRDPKLRANWWLFRRSNELIRSTTAGLHRFIISPETAKHRLFSFIDSGSRPEHSLICIASNDAFHLGVLSSHIHLVWALAAGGTLEDRPRYNKTRCFEPFPFPVCDDGRANDYSPQIKDRIRDLAEQLDAHRKRQQALHPDLTLTGMYNVLEKLRSGEPLTAKEKTSHEQGLVAILKQLHDELDAAVFAAYGWPATLNDAEILEKVVALNRERAREEEQGLIRWLRPEYQQPHAQQITVQDDLDLGQIPPSPPLTKGGASAASGGISTKLPWPKTLPEQVQAVRAALASAAAPLTAETIARTFQRARADKVQELLATLAALGQVREVSAGSFVA